MTVHVKSEFPSGPFNGIAFVAEAPSDEELDYGRPMIGPSGRVFNAQLRTAGVDRKESFVGNVFDEQLPENEIGNWCIPVAEARELGWKGDPPSLPKRGVLRIEHCGHLARLRSELERLQPRVIVPLGGTALWAFTGSDAISEFRGATVRAEFLVPGAKLVPTFHPAAVMREWRFYPVAVGDIMKALSEAQSPGFTDPNITALLEPTLDDLAAWDERIMSADLLSVDIETGWGHILCVGFAPSAHEALVVPFVDLRQPSKSYWRNEITEAAARRYVKRWMESPVPKLGQNFGAYDAYWFLEVWDIGPVNLREDTRILHHSLYPELPKDLAFMGNTYADQGAWKRMRARRKEKRED